MRIVRVKLFLFWEVSVGRVNHLLLFIKQANAVNGVYFGRFSGFTASFQSKSNHATQEFLGDTCT